MARSPIFKKIHHLILQAQNLGRVGRLSQQDQRRRRDLVKVAGAFTGAMVVLGHTQRGLGSPRQSISSWALAGFQDELQALENVHSTSKWPTHVPVAIVGGGTSGLTAAYRLAQGGGVMCPI